MIDWEHNFFRVVNSLKEFIMSWFPPLCFHCSLQDPIYGLSSEKVMLENFFSHKIACTLELSNSDLLLIRIFRLVYFMDPFAGIRSIHVPLFRMSKVQAEQEPRPSDSPPELFLKHACEHLSLQHSQIASPVRDEQLTWQNSFVTPLRFETFGTVERISAQRPLFLPL